jgi:uncharacterized protein (UPF0335 family)
MGETNGNGMGHNSGGGSVGAQINQFIERHERLEEERAAITAAMREVITEAKSLGFDTKALKHIMKLRKMATADRIDFENDVEIYKAAIGMLEGRPLSPPAARKLAGEEPELPLDPELPPPRSNAGDGGTDSDGLEEIIGEVETVDEAREKGGLAAREGKKITENPYQAGDVKRAACEGWCQETGSDGMEIPAAWQRRKPKEETEAAKPADGSEESGEEGGGVMPDPEFEPDEPPVPAPAH